MNMPIMTDESGRKQRGGTQRRPLSRLWAGVGMLGLALASPAQGDIRLSGESLDEVTSIPNALLQNVKVAQGRHGKCLSFADANSSILLPVKDVLNPEQGTIAMWVNNIAFTKVPPGGQRTKRFLFGAHYGANQWFQAGLVYYAGTPTLSYLSMQLDEHKQMQQVGISFEPLKHGWMDEQWHHLAFAWGGGKLKLYVDGALYEEKPGPGPVPEGWLTTLHIGAQATGNPRQGANSFNGLIDEILVSRRERSAEDIASDFKYGYKPDGTGAEMKSAVPAAGADVLAIPLAVSRPKIDGMLDEPAWAEAAVTTIDHVWSPKGADLEADERTTVYMMADSEKLYVAFKCPTRGLNLKNDHESVFYNDHVELFLAPFKPDRREYFLVAVNSNGGKLSQIRCTGSRRTGDSKNDEGWDGDIEYAGFVEINSYAVELAIPFARLGNREDWASDWGVNFVRHDTQTGRQTVWSSKEMPRGFLEPELFGTLKGIQEIVKAGDLRIENFDIGAIENQESALSFRIANESPEKQHVTVDFKVTRKRGGILADVKASIDLEPGKTDVVSVPYALKERGDLTYRVDIDQPGKRRTAWTTGSVAVNIPDAVAVTITRPVYRNTLFSGNLPKSVAGQVVLNVPNPEGYDALDLSIKGPDGANLLSKRFEPKSKVLFDLDAGIFARPGDYALNFTLNGADNKQLRGSSTLKYLKSIPGETCYDDGGFMCVDGKRFFPLGGYGLGSDVGMTRADARSGIFNVRVYGSPGDEFKDTLKTIPAIDGHYKCVKDGDWDRLKELVRTHDYAQHEDFFGYTIADEPFGSGNISAENLATAYEIITANAPHHMVSLVSNGSGRAARHRNHVDYIKLDIYPLWANLPLVTMYNEVKAAREYLWPKPVIAVPEGLPAPYAWYAGKGFGMPTRYEEMEVTAFLAITAGARGIIWFNMRYVNPDQAQWIRKVAAEKIKPLIPVLLTDDIEQPVLHTTDEVKTLVKKLEDAYVVLLVNSVDQEVNIPEIAIPAAWAKTRAEDFYTKREIPVQGRTLKDVKFGPYETRVLKIR